MIPVAFGWQNSASQGDSVSEHVTPTLDKSKTPAVAVQGTMINRSDTAGPMGPGFDSSGAAFTLTKADVHAVATAGSVRRLTPRECERLQGFPDDYTLIPYRNKLAADGPRYKAMGNSMAVPVMRWIGERIQMVEQYA
jgi:DNA (cytosine-5)-methyltransferase 1